MRDNGRNVTDSDKIDKNSLRVLVLDASMEPLYQTDWQDAIRLVFKGVCYTLSEYENVFLRSASKAYPFPAVIAFQKKQTKRKRETRFSRENLYLRDRGQCQYCGILLVRNSLTFDHVLPKSRGGKTDWTNIVAACCTCNQRKGEKTPEEAGMKLLRPPVKPKSLPLMIRQKVRFEDGMPQIWRSYLDWEYWESDLDA